jgi:hypothetical protein
MDGPSISFDVAERSPCMGVTVGGAARIASSERICSSTCSPICMCVFARACFKGRPAGIEGNAWEPGRLFREHGYGSLNSGRPACEKSAATSTIRVLIPKCYSLSLVEPACIARAAASGTYALIVRRWEHQRIWPLNQGAIANGASCNASRRNVQWLSEDFFHILVLRRGSSMLGAMR